MPTSARTLSSLKTNKNDYRSSSYKRGYNRRWRRASKIFLKKHPLCEICKKKGIIKSAECVDHIIPHKGDMKLFWDESNWQAACISCNSIKGDKIDSK